MPVSPGQTLASYQVLESIGQGGMGVVWKAHDTSLGREVALKFLPDFLAADPERLARFDREARLLASLNHPRVASIYGVHTVEATRFLALELVPGEDLSQRLARGPIPMDEALRIGLQIAEALEHAHDKGVIHRDLKPANIKLDAEGNAKVLDFGLAKALEGDARQSSSGPILSQSPTITGPMTAANVLLGTAAYMSPEQARGQTSDRRVDIWAFGVVLYEMLTGKRLFDGETVSDTLASVLRAEPDWTALPKETPPRVRRLLERCLDRDPKRRLRDIGEARLTLEAVLGGTPEDGAIVAAPAAARPNRMVWIGAALAALLLGWIAGRVTITPDGASTAPLRKFRILSGSLEDPSMASPVLSPDGRLFAYVSEGKLWIDDLAKSEPRAFAVDPAPLYLFWSPDSRHVGGISGSRIYRFAVEGGQSQLVCETAMAFTGGSGATWTEDDRIVFSQAESLGIQEVRAVGGTPRTLLPIVSAEESDFHEPHALPGDRGILFTPHRRGTGPTRIELLRGGERKVIFETDGSRIDDVVYSPTGHILFSKTQPTPGLYALPFSLRDGEATGEAFLVASEGLRPTVSKDGTLAYLEQQNSQVRELIWLDRAGQPVAGRPAIVADRAIAGTIALSRDGQRVAFGEGDASESDLWIHDRRRATKTRLTFGPGVNAEPCWSPSGDRIYYRWFPPNVSSASALRVHARRSDGTGTVDTLGTGILPRVTPDGRYVLWSDVVGTGSGWRILRAPADGSEPGVPFLAANGNLLALDVDPKQRWLAYMSNESGEWQVYLTRYPSAEGRWQVSTRGGQWPAWNAAGDRLYFTQGEEVMEVSVTGEATPELGVPERLFTRPSLGPQNFGLYRNFAVTGDGQAFLVPAPSRETGVPRGAMLVQNWHAEFAKE